MSRLLTDEAPDMEVDDFMRSSGWFGADKIAVVDIMPFASSCAACCFRKK